jgi:hypothetical protein
MSVIIQGYQIREILLGQSVNEPAKAVASGAIFTVSGGRVIVTSLIATAATAVSGGTSIAVVTAPTSGVVQTIAPATGSPTGLALGGMASVVPNEYNGTLTNTALPLQPGGWTLGDAGLVVPAGSINLTVVGSYTGTLTWDLTYVVYDTGASVSAV